MQTAVLVSGGLDSVVLLAEEAWNEANEIVQPIYVSVGLVWEDAERASLGALLAADPLRGRTRPLVSLTIDMRDVYEADHWAIEGRPPAYHTPDKEVYLPGRNVVLLGKAAVYCAAARVDRLVLGTLAHNPFPDATPAFRSAIADALSLGLAHRIAIDAPFSAIGQAEVIRRGKALRVPLQLTLSCMNPGTGLRGPQGDLSPTPIHCGTCSKCRERHDAFVEAGVVDLTAYADRSYVGTV